MKCYLLPSLTNTLVPKLRQAKTYKKTFKFPTLNIGNRSERAVKISRGPTVVERISCIGKDRDNGRQSAVEERKHHKEPELLEALIDIIHNKDVDAQTPAFIRLAEVLEVLSITLALGFQIVIILLSLETANLKVVNASQTRETGTGEEEAQSVNMEKIASSEEVIAKVKKEKIYDVEDRTVLVDPSSDLRDKLQLQNLFMIWQGLPIAWALIIGCIVRHFYKSKFEVYRGSMDPLSSFQLSHIDKEISNAVTEAKNTASQVDKLRLKLRLLSRELKPMMESLETAQSKQESALVEVMHQMNKTQNQLRDLEEVMCKSQDVAIKQFSVLAQSVRKLNSENKSISKLLSTQEENMEKLNAEHGNNNNSETETRDEKTKGSIKDEAYN